ncbi:MAG: glyoxalase/bleomycin resistance protein/dioxygenase [Frankiales bacterium]|jgi:catechol 2,3-dioxygenase-like lactoylglutathione lyase family enzyme|nr:glyoxalase/bleomycin resistance protein/dioxygenase [Frankiales bacterium]
MAADTTLTALARKSEPSAAGLPQTPQMLNHLAYVTPDAEKTVEFYTQVLGLEFVLAVIDDKVPSTGEPFPYFHIFFRLGDGSTIAFFEAPGLPPRAPTPHPAYEIFDHLALQVDSREAVDAWHARLTGLGLSVVGPVDHKIIYSVYFYDPVNDIRLEITTPLAADWNDRGEAAQLALADWSETKRQAAASGADTQEALLALIASRDHGAKAQPTDEVL